MTLALHLFLPMRQHRIQKMDGFFDAEMARIQMLVLISARTKRRQTKCRSNLQGQTKCWSVLWPGGQNAGLFQTLDAFHKKIFIPLFPHYMT